METIRLEAKKYSKPEYFNLLRSSLHKLEFLDGSVRLMPLSSIAHNDIIDNIFAGMWEQNKRYKVKNSLNAVSIPSHNTYVFPDISVINHTTKYEQGEIAIITNPEVIIEVLSENTSDYDRSDKFTAYRQLESFKEYILIDSRKMRVDTFYRETNELWHIRSYYHKDQEVEIMTTGISVPMTTIYDDIDFEITGDTSS